MRDDARGSGVVVCKLEGKFEEFLHLRLPQRVEDLLPFAPSFKVTAVVEDAQVGRDVRWGEAHLVRNVCNVLLSREECTQDAHAIRIG